MAKWKLGLLAVFLSDDIESNAILICDHDILESVLDDVTIAKTNSKNVSVYQPVNIADHTSNSVYYDM